MDSKHAIGQFVKLSTWDTNDEQGDRWISYCELMK